MVKEERYPKSQQSCINFYHASSKKIQISHIHSPYVKSLTGIYNIHFYHFNPPIKKKIKKNQPKLFVNSHGNHNSYFYFRLLILCTGMLYFCCTSIDNQGQNLELSEHPFMIIREKKKDKLDSKIFRIWLDSFGNLAALFQGVMLIL